MSLSYAAYSHLPFGKFTSERRTFTCIATSGIREDNLGKCECSFWLPFFQVFSSTSSNLASRVEVLRKKHRPASPSHAGSRIREKGAILARWVNRWRSRLPGIVGGRAEDAGKRECSILARAIVSMRIDRTLKILFYDMRTELSKHEI